MEFRHLRCFAAVAEQRHFGRAAAQLHIAQPAVSQTIASLERELGVRLFERTSREVSLTAAGQALLPHALGVLERVDTLVDAAEQLHTGSHGRVTVGVPAALPPEVLTDLLAIARATAPDVRVVAKAVGGTDPLVGLDGTYDLVLTRGPVRAPGVSAVLLLSEPVGVALPAGHPLAGSHELRGSDLNGQPLVTFARRDDPEQHDRIFSALRGAGFTAPNALHESPAGGVEASLRLVAAGEALSLKLQSEVVAFANPAVVWRPLADVHLEVEIHLAWRSDLSNPAALALAAAVNGQGVER